jgi:hypothetical protein
LFSFLKAIVKINNHFGNCTAVADCSVLYCIIPRQQRTAQVMASAVHKLPFFADTHGNSFIYKEMIGPKNEFSPSGTKKNEGDFIFVFY